MGYIGYHQHVANMNTGPRTQGGDPRTRELGTQGLSCVALRFYDYNFSQCSKPKLYGHGPRYWVLGSWVQCL